MLTVSTAMIRTVENVEKYKVIVCIVSMTLAFLFIYTTFIKRSIHKSICSNALLKTQ